MLWVYARFRDLPHLAGNRPVMLALESALKRESVEDPGRPMCPSKKEITVPDRLNDLSNRMLELGLHGLRFTATAIRPVLIGLCVVLTIAASAAFGPQAFPPTGFGTGSGVHPRSGA